MSRLGPSEVPEINMVQVAASPSIDATLNGELVKVGADKCLYWPKQEILFVADVHLGKGTSFRSLGIPVPTGVTESDLDSLSESIATYKAKRLVILGDLWHAKTARSAQTIESFSNWRASHSQLEVTLVVGNHDVRSGTCPPDWRVEGVSEGSMLGPFELLHYPDRHSGKGYGLAGHIHPGVRIGARSQVGLKVPCFWQQEHLMVLPAFGTFTGCASIQPETGDTLYLVAQNKVVPYQVPASR